MDARPCSAIQIDFVRLRRSKDLEAERPSSCRGRARSESREVATPDLQRPGRCRTYGESRHATAWRHEKLREPVAGSARVRASRGAKCATQTTPPQGRS